MAPFTMPDTVTTTSAKTRVATPTSTEREMGNGGMLHWRSHHIRAQYTTGTTSVASARSL